MGHYPLQAGFSQIRSAKAPKLGYVFPSPSIKKEHFCRALQTILKFSRIGIALVTCPSSLKNVAAHGNSMAYSWIYLCGHLMGYMGKEGYLNENQGNIGNGR